MSPKVRKTWDEHLAHLRQVLAGFPDRRTGDNLSYAMEDISGAAFSVFFTQCPSFLAHQKTMQQAKGQSNAQSLFHRQEIPSDNHIRQTLGPVPPEELFACYAYRYANGVPLAQGQDALKVSWCELTVTDHHQKVIYRNGWVTNLTITDQNVAALVAAGRARWKIENENNNTLKTKGYHLEHNFGRGKQHLSSLLAAMNSFHQERHPRAGQNENCWGITRGACR